MACPKLLGLLQSSLLSMLICSVALLNVVSYHSGSKGNISILGMYSICNILIHFYCARSVTSYSTLQYIPVTCVYLFNLFDPHMDAFVDVLHLLRAVSDGEAVS